MSQIKVVPLGAGQDVGRSCIIVSLGGKNIMFDCGMHMGYNDHRRFPNFKYISPSGNYNEVIDAVIISHFHLDHCGALPYFTEMCGYSGPIFMTYPTKAICPILLEDFRKITVERKGETNFFTSQMIKDCMKKVTAVNLHQTVQVDEDFEIKAYYAGHVLGAAMFYVRVGSESCLYTGDYNTTPDRHLGAAQVDKLRVDLLITETTYATTIRDSKRLRERDFLKSVHDTVERGGKVLIPVFALGRAQELCILLETYWQRMNLSVPIYFSAGLVERANLYYKLFINWTNQKIKSTFVKQNMFDFRHIKPFDRALIDKPGPCVLFATPGMLHAGMSLEVFKKWCVDEKNLCIIPGYCVAGTVGHKVIVGQKTIDIDKKNKVEVRCGIKSLSFSAHADAKGIMQLIQQCQPKNVMLCHGEKEKMGFLKQRIQSEYGIPCYTPANGETLTIQNYPPVRIELSTTTLKPQCFTPQRAKSNDGDRTPSKPSANNNGNNEVVDGLLIIREGEPIKLVHHTEASQVLGGIPEHTLRFDMTKRLRSPVASLQQLRPVLLRSLEGKRHKDGSVISLFEENANEAIVRSIRIRLLPDKTSINFTWTLQDECVASAMLAGIDEYIAGCE